MMNKKLLSLGVAILCAGTVAQVACEPIKDYSLASNVTKWVSEAPRDFMLNVFNEVETRGVNRFHKCENYLRKLGSSKSKNLSFYEKLSGKKACAAAVELFAMRDLITTGLFGATEPRGSVPQLWNSMRRNNVPEDRKAEFLGIADEALDNFNSKRGGESFGSRQLDKSVVAAMKNAEFRKSIK